ncbi:MAG: DUF2339 domain-containing protein [Treponema sp.]|jgi:uncharacterized membrane protein|nr:DUF2339 domain-containing protein [Treponema sp.]
MEGLLILIIGLFLFAVSGVIALLVKTGSLADENRRLAGRVTALESAISRLTGRELPQRRHEESAPPEAAVPAARPAVSQTAVQSSQPAEPILRAELSLPAASLFTALRAFIRGGNAWAAGGVALLIAGFGSLTAYLARRGFFTLEMGILAAALTGILLLSLGLALRKKRRSYCLLLQGGGIGILYLSVFAAHTLALWFSPLTALILLSLLLPPALILALAQGSQALAFFAFLGGFAAPLLTSAAGGGHVFFFSYYTALCLGVLAVSVFRFWRWLNLLAFWCVFGAAVSWVMRFYQPRLFWSSEPFFIAHILLFTVLGIHGLGKRAFRRDVYCDGVLLLGTPFLGTAVQWRIFAAASHGHALVSLSFAGFYLLLGIYLWKRRGAAMRLFAEGFLGLALLLANLAVPLELAPGITSAVWAAEGALCFFFGLRRKNAKTVLAAAAAHTAAAIAFIITLAAEHGQAALFRSPRFSGSLLIALASFAYILIARKFREQDAAGSAGGFFSRAGVYREGFFHAAAVWAYLWWFGGWYGELRRAAPDYGSLFFILSSLTALAAFCLARYTRCPSLLWGALPSAVHAAALIAGAFGGSRILIYQSRQPRFALNHNFFTGLYGFAWPGFLGIHGAASLLSRNLLGVKLRSLWLFTLILTAAAVLSSSGRALTVEAGLAPAWTSFAGLLPLFTVLIALSVLDMRGGKARGRKADTAPAMERGHPVTPPSLEASASRPVQAPYTVWAEPLLRFGLPYLISILLGLWFLASLFLPGNPAPLPWYIPLLNPLDMLEALSALLFLFHQSVLIRSGGGKYALGRGALTVIGDTALFLWITALLARSAHFYGRIPYDRLFDSSAFQLGLLAVWALYGFAHIILGTRLARRPVWIAGAVIILAAIGKLLLLDLAGAKTVARISSFFIAGLILLLTGWVSPLPPASSEPKGADGSNPKGGPL